jgi:hypothetical protein
MILEMATRAWVDLSHRPRPVAALRCYGFSTTPVSVKL